MNELTPIETFLLCIAMDMAGEAEKIFKEATQSLIDKGYLIPEVMNENSDLPADSAFTQKGREFIESLKAKE